MKILTKIHTKMDLKKIRGVIIGHQKSKDHDKAADDFSLLKSFEETGGTVDIQTWNMLINLSENDMTLTCEVFEHIRARNLLSENSYTAMIKILCECEQFYDSFELLKEMISVKIDPHLRTFLHFFSSKLPMDLFEKLIDLLNKFSLTPSFEMFGRMIRCSKNVFDDNGGDVNTDGKNGVYWFNFIVDWINKRCNFVPSSMIDDINYAISSTGVTGTECQISGEGTCKRCKCNLTKFDFTDEERTLFLDKLGNEFKNIESIKRYVDGHKNYDVIVDGANVSMFNNKPFNGKKVESVVSHFTTKGKKVLVVFNINRKKQVLPLNINKNKLVDVFYSESGSNDDLFWLYCGFHYKNSWVVTDDKMCDHIFNIFNDLGIHIFKKWADSHVARFRFTNDGDKKKDKKGWLKVIYPNRYSEKMQFRNIPLHVPVSNTSDRNSDGFGGRVKWFCFSEIDEQNNVGKRVIVKDDQQSLNQTTTNPTITQKDTNKRIKLEEK